MVVRVAPAYRVVLSDEGVSLTYRVSVFGVKLFDGSGSAPWEDVFGLDCHSIGWVWGLALFFPVDGKVRTVFLNRGFTSKKEGLRFVVAKLPAWRISDKARKKLVRMGILAS